jgi:hypothetical protein
MTDSTLAAGRIAATIRRKGAPAVLESRKGDYDSSTSDVLASAKRFDCYAIRVEYQAGEIDGDSVRSSDIQLWMGTTTTNGDPIPQPKQSDRLLFDSQWWSVLTCKPVKPGAVAFAYKVQARR